LSQTPSLKNIHSSQMSLNANPSMTNQ
jgi:hypothetical protein